MSTRGMGFGRMQKSNAKESCFLFPFERKKKPRPSAVRSDGHGFHMFFTDEKRDYLPAFFTALSAAMRPQVAHMPWPMPPMVL